VTKVLIHELPEQTQLLLERLRRVLEANPKGLAKELLVRARVEPAEKPRMVLTGQYSSGKSSLIKALTDAAVNPEIDADIATDRVSEYAWDGAVVLVDTPGVQSGLRRHDELAREAIGKADFILFVITVNLFDDASRDYLRRLANDLRLFGQMIVVITQASMQSAAEGVRGKAVQAALGTVTFNLPIVEVDSVYYLQSLEGGPRAELRRQRSGIDELRDLINKISEDRGELAQLRQPLHLVRQLCDEAQELFVADDRSQSALAVIASQRAAVSQRRYGLERAFAGAEADFKSRCLVDVTGFVDAATSLTGEGGDTADVLAAAEVRLVEALERHAGLFAESINRLAETQFDTLSVQLAEIGEGPRAQSLLQLEGDVAIAGPDRVLRTNAVPMARMGTAGSVNWKRLAEQLTNGQKWWGAGNGLKDASGSVGHKIVLDLGHTFGKKFKPWEALKIADQVGKFAKFGGFAIQVGAAGYEVWKNERDARNAQREGERQHSAFVTEIMGHADKIAAEVRTQLWSIADPPMNEFLAELQAAQDEILGADEAREVAQLELRAIATETDRLLRESGSLQE
jgi:hypothetical protein